jgi:hypothetical protein
VADSSGAGAGAPPSRATLYVAVDGSDAGGCTLRSPCASFDRAYRVARPGDVVEVAGGTYPPQAVEADPRKAGPHDVVFRPAPRSRVTIGCRDDGDGCLDVSASHVTFVGMRTRHMPPVAGTPWQGRIWAERGADDVSFVAMDAGAIAIGSTNTRVLGGDYGPSIDPLNIRLVGESRNVVFDSVLIHDFRVARGGHFECMTIDGGTNITIRNAEFRTCSTFAIFAKPSEPLREVLIENTIFWNPGGVGQVNELKFSNDTASCTDVTIRNNVISDNVYDTCDDEIEVVGNIQLAAQASCGADWSDNVFERARPCGMRGRLVRNVRFVDRAAGDFHLNAGSPAIDRGSSESFAARDRDGQQRPLGTAPDAGVDEVR